MQSKLKMTCLLAMGLAGAALLPSAFAAPAGYSFGSSASDAQVGPLEAAARASWRQDMAHVATPAQGCFHAVYPSIVWQQVACNDMAPRSHPVPRWHAFGIAQTNGSSQTTGNGNDYTIQTASLISETVGSFPSVSGVTSETGVGVASYGGGGILGANEYSLQINSSFNSTTSACGGRSGCTIWQQFVYAPDYQTSGEASVFMQYWLIGYGGHHCPRSWGSDGYGDCYRNSAITVAPDVPATDLASAKLTGTVTSGGNDTVVFTYGTNAYSSSGSDSVLYLSQVWNSSEFNVVGNAGGSEADFNSGSSLTVNVAVNDGSTSVPSCVANSGSTGESNNLNLGSCSAYGGSMPYIQFTESN